MTVVAPCPIYIKVCILLRTAPRDIGLEIIKNKHISIHTKKADDLYDFFSEFVQNE